MLAAFTIEYYLENSLCIFLNYSVSYSDQPDRWCNGKRARLECDGAWVWSTDKLKTIKLVITPMSTKWLGPLFTGDKIVKDQSLTHSLKTSSLKI